MTIYSVMPIEAVMEGFDEHRPHYVEMVVDGIRMQVEPTSDQSARIVRLISTNPYDYLRTDCAPGMEIAFEPRVVRGNGG